MSKKAAKSKPKTVTRQKAKGCRRPSCCSPLCEWCVRCLAENTKHGLDTKFDPACADRSRVRGVIVLDGNRSRLMERIQRLIEDAENAQADSRHD